jgi:hypothetical protein
VGRIGVASHTFVFREWGTFLLIVLTLVAAACSGGTSTPTPPPPAASTPGSGPTARQGQIAFASDRHGNFEIYVMNADGTGMERLTNDPADDVDPAWSPASGASP